MVTITCQGQLTPTITYSSLSPNRIAIAIALKAIKPKAPPESSTTYLIEE